MFKKLVIALVFSVPFLSFSQPASNSNFSISGSVVDSLTSKPVEYATVALITIKDSSIVAGGITDSNGNYFFYSNRAGRFLLRFDFIGYVSKYVGPILIRTSASSSIDIGKTYIQSTEQSLAVVTIVAEKPLVELSIDKKVVNVEKNISTAGGTALDVLKEVHSVEVDADGNVSMRGSENITILIDGRPSTLTSANRRAALEQITAESISTVELITNPSAKYSPEGMTGIINIVLKKKKGTGLNTLLSINVGTGNKYSANFSASYSTNKYTIFGSYNYQNRQNIWSGNTDRTSYLLDDTRFWHQKSEGLRKMEAHGIKLGGEYYFNLKLIAVISISSNIYTDKENGEILNFTQNPQKKYTSIFKNIANENSDMLSFDGSFNLKKRFNKPKHEITLDYSISKNKIKNNDFNKINYFKEDFVSEDTLMPEWSNTNIPNENMTNTLKLDYIFPINDSTKIEIGFDGSIRNIYNNNRYYDYNFVNESWMFNTLRSNNFLYDENIGAIYINYSTQLHRWGLSAGSRFELANTNARKADSTNNIKTYFSWFPTGAISYKFSKRQEIMLTYSRRINRPSAWNLNPSIDYSNYPNLRSGNPYLNPEYVNAIEMSYAWYSIFGTFMPTIFYRRVNDVISRYRQNINDTIFLMTMRNYKSSTSFGFEMIYTYRPIKWWNTTLSGSFYRNIVDGSNVEERINADGIAWQIRNSNTFRFTKGWEGQFSLFYNSPRLTGQGKRSAMFFSDISIKKSFSNDRFTLSLNVRDLLNTRKFKMEFDEKEYYMISERMWEGRVFMLGFTWKMTGDYKQQRERRANIDNGGRDDDF